MNDPQMPFGRIEDEELLHRVQSPRWSRVERVVHQNSNLLVYVDAGDWWSVADLYEIQSLPCQRSHQVCIPDYDVSSVSLRVLNSGPRYLIGSEVVGEGNMTCESKARVRGCGTSPQARRVSYRGCLEC